jgi:SAM-dependent methyltransferase
MAVQRSIDEWRDLCEQITGGHILDAGKRAMVDSGIESVVRHLRPHGLPVPGSVVLDVGCGNGRIAMGLVEDDITYIGLEPSPEAVAFCRMAFAPWPYFRFEHLDVEARRYTRANRTPPERVVWPVASETVDLVLMFSVFTHIPSREGTLRAVSEARRVLRLGGLFLSTWFRCPPHKPFCGDAHVAWPQDDIETFLYGWERVADWGGTEADWGDQWHILSCKREA